MFVNVGRKTHCGHEHESFESAQKCLVDYQNLMRKQNKLSDRTIIEVESLEELAEQMEIY